MENGRKSLKTQNYSQLIKANGPYQDLFLDKWELFPKQLLSESYFQRAIEQEFFPKFVKCVKGLNQ